MTAEKVGSLIGAIFGMVFVLANVGGLPSGVAAVLRILGIAAFVGVLIAVGRRPRAAVGSRPAGGGFGRDYWLVVAAEVLAIGAGLVVLNRVLDAPQAAVAWISLVVGTHFIGLAVVWREAFFHWLGAAILLCGVVGLVLAATAAPAGAINVVGGVLPGAVLLAFAVWGSTRGAAPTTTPARTR